MCTSLKHFSTTRGLDISGQNFDLIVVLLILSTQVIASPAIGDFNSDGRLDVAYSVVWSSIVPGGTVPELKVFAFTLEERYRQTVGVTDDNEEGKGQKVVNFESFLPADQQPWSRYMGRHGNNIYHRGG